MRLAALFLVVLFVLYCIAGTSDWQIEQKEMAAEVERAAQVDR